MGKPPGRRTRHPGRLSVSPPLWVGWYEYPAKAGGVNMHIAWHTSPYPQSCSVCWCLPDELACGDQCRRTGSGSALEAFVAMHYTNARYFTLPQWMCLVRWPTTVTASSQQQACCVSFSMLSGRDAIISAIDQADTLCSICSSFYWGNSNNRQYVKDTNNKWVCPLFGHSIEKYYETQKNDIMNNYYNH